MPEIRDLISRRDLNGPIPALTSVIGLILPWDDRHCGYRLMDPVQCERCMDAMQRNDWTETMQREPDMVSAGQFLRNGHHPVGTMGYHAMDTIVMDAM